MTYPTEVIEIAAKVSVLTRSMQFDWMMVNQINAPTPKIYEYLRHRMVSEYAHHVARAIAEKSGTMVTFDAPTGMEMRMRGVVLSMNELLELLQKAYFAGSDRRPA